MRRVAIAVSIAAIFGNTADSASIPKFPANTPYREARRSLLALGYKPIVLPDADEVSRSRCGFGPTNAPRRTASAPPGGDERCFPEMEACAGTGLGQCIFGWQRAETLIEVFTANELPVVSGVKCRINC